MLEVKALPRVFIMSEGGYKKDVPLADPGAHLLPAEVCAHYAVLYPLLASCNIEGPTIEPRGQVYYFKPTFGTKG